MTRKEFVAKRDSYGRDKVVEGHVVHEFEQLPPIYFSSHGYICGECNNLMIEDGLPRNGKVKAFCSNLHCSQNLVTKEIKCPVTTNYEVIPVDAA